MRLKELLGFEDRVLRMREPLTEGAAGLGWFDQQIGLGCGGGVLMLKELLGWKQK